jgi:hypothetical protein
MAAHKQVSLVMNCIEVDPKLLVPNQHPRVFARIRSVALSRAQNNLLAHLDRLIDKLELCSSITGSVSNHANAMRLLRGEVAAADFGSAGMAIIVKHIAQVKQHMAEITADFLAFSQAKDHLSTTRE